MVPNVPPLFSVIIPTYMRPRHLNSCLKALAKQDHPREDFEVIVVDDGGLGSLESLIDTFRKRLDIKLVKKSQAGPAAARNKGAESAKGSFLGFTDDDCAPARNWLRLLAKHVNEKPTFAFGGRVVNMLQTNTFSTASQLLITYLCRYYNNVPGKAKFVTSNNLFFPAQLFKKVGGFDIQFRRAGAEDRELCARWLQYGYSIDYTNDTVVYHAHVLTLWGFLRQHFSYGRGAFVYYQKRLRKYGDSFKVEPLEFYIALFKYPFSCDQGRGAMLMLFVVSQFANIAGYLTEAVRKVIRQNVLRNR